MKDLLRLLLVPVWLYWGVFVLLPGWIIGNIRRWYRRRPEVRARALRRHHSKEAREWAQYEREVKEILQGLGVIDTPTNRLMYAKSIEKALVRRRLMVRLRKRSQ